KFEKLFAVDIDDLVSLRVGMRPREPDQGCRKHRVAIRVIVMPWRFGCFLPPPGLHVISQSGVDEARAIDFPVRRSIVSRTRNQTTAASRAALVQKAPAATAARASAKLREGDDTHSQNKERQKSNFHLPREFTPGGCRTIAKRRFRTESSL